MRRFASEMGWGLAGLALSPYFIFRYAAWFARSWWVGRHAYSVLGFLPGDEREGYVLQAIGHSIQAEKATVSMEWVKEK